MKSPLTLTIPTSPLEEIKEEKPVYPLSENEKALLSWVDHYFTNSHVLKQEDEEYYAVLKDLEKVKTQYQKTTYAYGSVAGASVVALLVSLFLSGTIISVASGGLFFLCCVFGMSATLKLDRKQGMLNEKRNSLKPLTKKRQDHLSSTIFHLSQQKMLHPSLKEPLAGLFQKVTKGQGSTEMWACLEHAIQKVQEEQKAKFMHRAMFSQSSLALNKEG